MITYECPKCGFTYTSPVRIKDAMHDCKTSRNHQQALKEKT